jgi:dTDP-4-amino-4,6-dideoxygalactose transaminase
MAIVTKYDLFFIEDCAHAYNTFWDGIPLGRFGKISCFSTQSSKGLSSGEGGIFVTDNEEFAAKAILYAGSYEKLWQAHYNVNPELMNKWQNQIPGYSLRMQEITASILRPQISRLNVIHKIHTENFDHLEELFSNNENIEVPQPFPKVSNFNDTMQFHLVGLTREQADQFIEVTGLEGVPMQIFGAGRNARDFREWKYTGDVVNSEMEQTVANIEFACDLSLQPHLGIAEIETIASVISDVLLYVQE